MIRGKRRLYSSKLHALPITTAYSGKEQNKRERRLPSKPMAWMPLPEDAWEGPVFVLFRTGALFSPADFFRWIAEILPKHPSRISGIIQTYFYRYAILIISRGNVTGVNSERFAAAAEQGPMKQPEIIWPKNPCAIISRFPPTNDQASGLAHLPHPAWSGIHLVSRHQLNQIANSKPDLLSWDFSYMNLNNRVCYFGNKSSIKFNWYRLNVRNNFFNNIGVLSIQGLGTEHRTENRTEEGMKNTRCRVGEKPGLGNNF